jgi:AcrR family transcriptional regulator
MSDEPPRFDPAGLAELPDELTLGRLPVGRHGLPRSFVVRNQRLRIVAAMLRILPRRGYAETTIGDVTNEAGVSRAAFYGQFAGKEDCFLATYELVSRWLCESVERAVAGRDEWPDRVRVGVAEALRLLAVNPEVAHLVAIEALQAGPAARRQQRASLIRFTDALRAGRPSPQCGPDLEELLLGGALSLVARYVEDERTAQLPDVGTTTLSLYFLK